MTKYSKELSINSIQRDLPLVEKLIDEICDNYHISNRFYGNILLAVEEAVRNGIVHGNKMDPGKSVKVVFERRPIGLFFRIEDEGPGFDIKSIPNPLETDQETGNGIFLIRSLADKVKYNSAGNSVEILFSISSINQETTLHRISCMNNYFDKYKTTAK
jgi:serine/threonine-protein kinase RsbW